MSKYGIIARDADYRWHYYRSQSAAKREGHCQQAISLCLAGKRQSHDGLVWSHAGPCDRLTEFTTTFCHRDPDGKPIGVDELWEAYRAWVPQDWLSHLDREEFERGRTSGWYWKPTAPQRKHA